MFYSYSDNKDFAMDSLGKSYDFSYHKDREALKERERRIKAAEKRHGRLLRYDEREEVKDQAWAMIDSGSLEDRYIVLLELMNAYFSSSLELAIKNGYEPRHPAFEEYARYFDRTGIPDDLRPLLDEKYPYKPGVIATEDTYWRPEAS